LSIASSSSGNAHALDTGRELLLIDCGISPKKITAGLTAINRRPEEISHILISHCHSDHIGGLFSLLKKYSIHVFGPAPLGPAVKAIGAKFTPLAAGMQQLNGFRLTAFNVSHDMEPTFGFRMEARGKTISYANDLGCWDEGVLEGIEGCDLLVWEANHDEGMLRESSYPEAIKRRIAGPKGHLSNRQSVVGIASLARLPNKLVVGHLSKENNSVTRVEDAFSAAHIDKHLELTVLDPLGGGANVEL